MKFITISILSVFLFLTSCKDSEKKDTNKETITNIQQGETGDDIKKPMDNVDNLDNIDDLDDSNVNKTEQADALALLPLCKQAYGNFKEKNRLYENLNTAYLQSIDDLEEYDRLVNNPSPDEFIETPYQNREFFQQKIESAKLELKQAKKERDEATEQYEKFAPQGWLDRLEKWYYKENYCGEKE